MAVAPKLTQEEIVQQFNQMRQEQRVLVSKIGELEGEVSEHTVVINTLVDVATDRKVSVTGFIMNLTIADFIQ